MIFLAAAGVFAALTLVGVMMVLRGGGGSSQLRDLLIDLGLARKWSGEATTPFYRWGWKKTSTDRVWGERIVKKAFQKAGVWVQAEDMQYFKARCEDHAANRKVKDEAIIERVQAIVERNNTLTEHLTSHLKVIIDDVLRLSQGDAQKRLEESGAADKKGSPHAHLSAMNLRRFLKKAGHRIINPSSEGFTIEGAREGNGLVLKGHDSWVTFLQLVKRCLNELLKKGAPIASEVVRQHIQTKIIHQLVKLYENDLVNHESYLQAIEQQIENDELELTIEKVESLEKVLYVWQFDESTDFNEVHHQRFRSFMTRRDLAPVFRKMVLEGLSSSITSVGKLIRSFPKNIIFIGSDHKARAFAIKFYQYHLQRLFEVFDGVLEHRHKPPAHVLIPLEDIKRARTEKYQENERRKIAARKGFDKGGDDEETALSLEAMIEKNRKYAAFERKVAVNQADLDGYLINVPIGESDMLPDEYRELTSGSLSSYAQFDCDTAGDVDFTSNSTAAKNERNEFFKRMIQVLHGSSGGPASLGDDVLDAMDSSAPPSLMSA